MFLDDSACNLASINLMKFRREDGSFDAERFQAACRLVFIAQEILVDHASYPTQRIAANSHRYRPIGLGYSNLGSLIMASGLPYDSERGPGAVRGDHRPAARGGQPHQHRVGRGGGPLRRLRGEPRAHAAGDGDAPGEGRGDRGRCPRYLVGGRPQTLGRGAGRGSRYGFRNAQATVLAPTGTISFMMDCDTTGIEPDIALVKYKQLAGGGMLKIVNQTVPLALRTLGYDEKPRSPRSWPTSTSRTRSRARPDLKPPSTCRCSTAPSSRAKGTRSIPWKAHVLMMAAAQPFLSGAISKTVNMPRDTTAEDIADAYREGWRLGLKALAVYRDGSKEAQPVSTQSEADKAARKGGHVAAPRRERLPDTRQSITHKFSVAGHEGYITVGLYPDGRPGELFITMAKEGSTIGGLMDCFGTAVSMSLQYGVPLEVYVNKFSHTRFEPMGLHEEPRHPHCQEHRGLHLPLAGNYLPAGLSRGQQPPCRPDGRGGSAAGRRRNRGGDQARRQEGRRAGHRAKHGRARNGQDRRPGLGPRLGQRAIGQGRACRGQRRPDQSCANPPCPAGQRRSAGPRQGSGQRCLGPAPRFEHPGLGGRVPAERSGAGRVARHRLQPQRAVRQVPGRRPALRQLRRDHRAHRQLLPLPQLRQQHGMFVGEEGEEISERRGIARLEGQAPSFAAHGLPRFSILAAGGSGDTNRYWHSRKRAVGSSRQQLPKRP